MAQENEDILEEEALPEEEIATEEELEAETPEGEAVGLGELAGIDPANIEGLEGANVGDKLTLIVDADVADQDEEGMLTLTINSAQMGQGSEMGGTEPEQELTDALLGEEPTV